MVDSGDRIDSIWDAEDARIASHYKQESKNYYDDENNAYTIYDLMDKFEIPYDDFETKTEYDPISFEPTLENVKDFFEDSESEEVLEDMEEYYTENNIPKEKQITAEDLVRTFEPDNLEYYGNADFDYRCTESLSNDLNRTFPYPEYKVIQQVFAKLGEYLSDLEQRTYDDDQPQFSI